MRKGQVSIEYMLVVTFMFLMLAPLLVLFATTQKDTTDTLVNGQLLHVANTLRDAAERVYFAGAPAQEQIQIYLPDGVKSISLSNTSIVFSVAGGDGGYDVLVPSQAPMNGTFLINKGTHIVTVAAANGTVQISEAP